MRTSFVFGLWPMMVHAAAVSRSTPEPYVFRADDATVDWEGKVNQFPLSYNFSDTQQFKEIEIDGSFWANAFVKGSNGHQYLLVNHAMDYASEYGPGTPLPYRSSILDITEPDSLYTNFVKFAPANASIWGPSGEFKAEYPGWGMASTSTENPLEGIRCWCDLEGIEFDFTFYHTSPALLNAALASYWVGGELGWEWSGVKSYTTGWFVVDGERVDIVPEESSTWYDRQWGSLQDGFQWIAMVFEESSWLEIDAAAVWDWNDAVNGPKEFATVRDPFTGRDSTVPARIVQSETNVWTSPDTGLVYPLEWVVYIEDFTITVTAPRPQIVEADPETNFPNQFSGYVELLATKEGHPSVRGHGAVDYLHPFP